MNRDTSKHSPESRCQIRRALACTNAWVFDQRPIFRGVGYKFGGWLDVGWWQLDLQPERDSPTEPHPLSSMYGNPVVLAALAEGNRKFAAEFSSGQ